MKKKYFILLLILSFVLNFAKAQKNYFNEYRILADSLAANYQIPASVMLAVAYHESGAGTSVIARRLNNHFGMKGRVQGGDTVSVKSSYKYFPTVSDSYDGFCKYVSSKKLYLNLKGNNDYKKWIIAISKTGYAGNAKLWSRQIVSIIQKYNLDNPSNTK